MILGIVSNCWRAQLAEGVPLELLVDRATREGYRAIELRQGCLGEFETPGEFFPVATRLAELPAKFPEMRINIALAFPFYDPSVGQESPLFQAGLNAAAALAGRFQPHLRLVDVTTDPEVATQTDGREIINNLIELTRAILARGGMLSLENGKHVWMAQRGIVKTARTELGVDGSRLLHCYDACNLLNAADMPDSNRVVRGLQAADLAMVHFKQARGGEAQPTVCVGDIDWRYQLKCLQEVGFIGPALFELPAHEQIWDHLRQSREYLAGLGLKLN